jgi:cell division protein FtsB
VSTESPADNSAGKKKGRRVPLGLSLQASGFTVTVLALIVLGVVVLSPSLRVLAEQQQQIAQLEAELAAVDQEVLALEEQLDRWSDRAFVEAQARSRLMFVYPGDITYLVIDDVDVENPDIVETISEDIEVVSSNWMKSLFASYLIAATTQAPRSEQVDEPGVLQPLPSPQSGGGVDE